MPNDLQLSDQDEVLLESLVLAASDNVARAPASDRDQFAPERRRAFVETSGNENVYLGTGSEWVDVSENTGLLSKLFSGGDGNFDSVNTGNLLIGDVEYLNHINDYVVSGGGAIDISDFDSLTMDYPDRELILLLKWNDGGTQQDIHIRFNGDGAATGNYGYVDESGTETAGENNIVLMTQSSPFNGAYFTISISRAFETLLSVDRAMVREDRADSIAQRGFRDTVENTTSIQIIPTSGTDGTLKARLFERRFEQP